MGLGLVRPGMLSRGLVYRNANRRTMAGAVNRLEQLQAHMAPVADPWRLDSQVVLVTGGGQGE